MCDSIAARPRRYNRSTLLATGQLYVRFPLAIILLEMGNAGSKNSRGAQIKAGVKGGLQSPRLWAPVLGTLAVLVGLHIPKDMASALETIGSATSSVAVFTIGLTLAAHAFHLSKAVVLGTLGRITLETAVLLTLLQLFHVHGPFAREALVRSSFPLATAVVLVASRYKAMEADRGAR
jgi:predicted permease